jgi:hypothetical protein
MPIWLQSCLLWKSAQKCTEVHRLPIRGDTSATPDRIDFSQTLGDDLYPSRMTVFAAQFPSTLRLRPKTGCWEFTGSKDAYGYGRMFRHNKELKAHRFFYELCGSTVPRGAYLQHHLPPEKCIGHACCNPAHLRLSNSPKAVPAPQVKRCPKGHPMTPENTVIESRKGHPKARCRKCRQESWRKNSARRTAMGKHT